MAAIIMPAEAQEPVEAPDVTMRACAICEHGGTNARTLAYAKVGRQLVECANCGFTYAPKAREAVHMQAAGNGRMRLSDLLLCFLDRVTYWRRFMFSPLEPYELLNKLGPDSGNVVDVGCHRDNLRLISPRFSIYGLAGFPALAAHARAEGARTGATVLSTTAAEGLSRFPDRSLAGVVLYSHLERDADARSVVALLGRKLRFDGVAVLKLANYGSLNRLVMGKRWYKFNFPDYLNYFRKRDISALAACFGLEVSFPLMLSLPTDDNFIAILKPIIPIEIY